VPSGRGAEIAKTLYSSTRSYVAAGYASIFASTPISQLQHRVLCLSELQPIGEEIAAAMEKNHGTPPTVSQESLDDVTESFNAALEHGTPLALAMYLRIAWATGWEVRSMEGLEMWDVLGYRKATLAELIVDGKLERCKELPPPVRIALEKGFGRGK